MMQTVQICTILFNLSLFMEYAICTVPAAPVRKEPGHRFEMTNQLLFGETMKVLETKDEWIRIQSTYDDYEGWLTNHLISHVEESIALKPLKYVSISALNLVTGPYGQMNVTIGSHLTGYIPETRELWHPDLEYWGSVKDINGHYDGNSVLRYAMEWRNAPYMWGGKTILGVDCSGYVQTVFKLFGIRLYRDAFQQAEQGKLIPDLSKANESDLAFFSSESGKIIHVGILLDKEKIIHASGKVRVDKIDKEGIVNSDTGKRTHRLHSIKRVI